GSAEKTPLRIGKITMPRLVGSAIELAATAVGVIADETAHRLIRVDQHDEPPGARKGSAEIAREPDLVRDVAAVHQPERRDDFLDGALLLKHERVSLPIALDDERKTADECRMIGEKLSVQGVRLEIDAVEWRDGRGAMRSGEKRYGRHLAEAV